MKKLVGFCTVLAVIASVGMVNAYGQMPTSCLKLLGSNTGHPEYDTTFHNPDSIYVDSCIGSASYLHKFAKQWYDLEFEYGSMLPIPAVPVDTIINIEWNLIDTNYTGTRAGFDTLQQKFGHFILEKGIPRAGDTSDFLSRIFEIRFDSIVDINAIVNQMSRIPLLYGTARYLDRSGIMNSVAAQPEERSYLIHPNPAKEMTTAEISTSQSGLFSLQLYDVLGKKVKDVFSARIEAGKKEITVDLQDLSIGEYYLRLAYPGGVKTMKLVHER
ncbi:MAG: T9SS type A sorting domain-containing protein [Ignavibacteriota bacterium]